MKETGWKTTGAKERGVGETGGKETKVKAMGMRETEVREMGGNVSGEKVTEAQVSHETGGKGDRLIGERKIDKSLPGDNAAGQNVTEGIQQRSYSEVDGERKRARVFVGDSIVRKSES